jgi:hypothetical protein
VRSPPRRTSPQTIVRAPIVDATDMLSIKAESARREGILKKKSSGLTGVGFPTVF